MGNRPFDEDKSVVCVGGDYMVGMFSFPLGLRISDQRVSDGLLRHKRSRAVGLALRGKIRSRLRTEHEVPFRLEVPSPVKRVL